MKQWTRELRFRVSAWDCRLNLRAVRECQGGCQPGHPSGKDLKIPEHPGLKIPAYGLEFTEDKAGSKAFPLGIVDGSCVYFGPFPTLFERSRG